MAESNLFNLLDKALEIRIRLLCAETGEDPSIYGIRDTFSGDPDISPLKTELTDYLRKVIELSISLMEDPNERLVLFTDPYDHEDLFNQLVNDDRVKKLSKIVSSRQSLDALLSTMWDAQKSVLLIYPIKHTNDTDLINRYINEVLYVTQDDFKVVLASYERIEKMMEESNIQESV